MPLLYKTELKKQPARISQINKFISLRLHIRVQLTRRLEILADHKSNFIIILLCWHYLKEQSKIAMEGIWDHRSKKFKAFLRRASIKILGRWRKLADSLKTINVDFACKFNFYHRTTQTFRSGLTFTKMINHISQSKNKLRDIHLFSILDRASSQRWNSGTWSTRLWQQCVNYT